MDSHTEPLLNTLPPKPKSHWPKSHWVRFVAVLSLAGVLALVVMLLSLRSSFNSEKASSNVNAAVRAYGSASLIQTARGKSSDFHERWVQKPDLTWVADFETTSDPVVELEVETLDQEILGFGGAFTETAATVFYKLTKERQEELLNMYFSSDGLGYTMGRTHINSCDFSLSSYSFDDVKDDWDLAHFDTKVQRDVDSGLIGFIKEAQEKIKKAGGNLSLLASPWSPPEWMKMSGQMDGLSHGEEAWGLKGATLTTVDTIHPKYYQVWGRYIAKWVSSYKAMGIPIWAITVQNEPGYDSKWESNMFTAQQEAEFLGKDLGPAMAKLNPEVAIFFYDWDHADIVEWSHTIFNHPIAGKYASGVAWHWYRGDLFSLVKKIHGEYPKAMLLPSEVTYEQKMWHKNTTVQDGDWSFGEGYGHDIMGNLNAGATGWLDWNLILDPTGGPNHAGNVCDATIMANLTTSSLFVHPQYYYIGHFSRYILPGSRRTKLTVSGTVGPVSYQRAHDRGYGKCTAEDGLQATAWQRPDKQIIVVVLNCASTPVNFKIKDGSRALRAMIPAHGIQTYKFKRFLHPAKHSI